MKLPVSILTYSTSNIGDDIQSLAMYNYLKKNNFEIKYFVNRDNYNVYDINFNKTNSTEKTYLILNCWFTDNKNPFNFPENIIPIFLSIHYSPNIKNNYINLFKKYEPIGCRDTYTYNLFKNNGINAILIGCPTLTFDINDFNIRHTNKINNIYIGDKPTKKYDIITDHRKKQYFELNKNNRLHTAKNILEYYINDVNYIETNRLHCYLPCLSLGLNVKLISIPDNLSSKERMKDYLDDKFINNIKFNIDNNIKQFFEIKNIHN